MRLHLHLNQPMHLFSKYFVISEIRGPSQLKMNLNILVQLGTIFREIRA